MNAYSRELLVQEINAQNVVSITEDQAVAIYRGFFSYLRKSADLSKTPYDNVAKPVYDMIELAGLSILDHIDGKDDPNR